MKTQKETKLTYPTYLKKGIALAKDYFLKSEEKYIACALLLGAILCVMAMVALLSILSSWYAVFWAAFMAANTVAFISSLITFSYIAIGFTLTNVLKNYLVETLCIHWRNWLTQKLMNKYISGDNNYLDLMRQSTQIDNPAQRIQEDIQSVVNTSISLFLELFNAAFTLVIFIGTLWVVGGALSFVVLGASITIPGYLVWCVILFSTLASFITHKIGWPLTHLTNNQKNLEADFRKDMEFMNNHSENIAQERSEPYHKRSFLNRLQEIGKNAYQKLNIRSNLIAFESFYSLVSSVFPYIVTAPLYFAGQTSLGQVMQIAYAWGQVSISLDWFINSYETLAMYKANVERLIELEQALEAGGIASTPKNIHVEESNIGDKLCVKHLNIATPSSTNFIMRELNLNINRGENTLIQGPSGLGKSTLFKVLAGTWKYGDGDVIVPHHRKICLLSQKPTIPHDTLRAILAYPDSVDTYTNEQYTEVLRAVGNIDQFIAELDTKSAWSTRLSAGQQQRVSVARALLKKPEWLLLDETTASLDPASEQHLYHLIKNRLRGTTFISIAHRPSVAQFHERVITFDLDNEGQVTLSEQKKREPSVNATNDETLLPSASLLICSS